MLSHIPSPARTVLEQLHNAGYAAYVVGGCVRDACLGLTPQDYDLCTSALPEQTENFSRRRRLSTARIRWCCNQQMWRNPVSQLMPIRQIPNRQIFSIRTDFLHHHSSPPGVIPEQQRRIRRNETKQTIVS